MCWRKLDLWKAGIAIASILILPLLVPMIWLPVSAAHAYERASGSATPGTIPVQVTPTEDATVTTLNKEKLAQEVQQLKEQNDAMAITSNKEKLQHENDWWWNYGATILTSLISTLALAAAGVFTVVRYFNDRRDTREEQEAEAKRLAEDRKAERERRDEEQLRWLKDQESERDKRAEERFQAVVEGLSSEREGARVGAAILLRTFLHPGYEQFYTQTFDLAVANLRLRHLDPATPEPLTSLSQALVVALKESFPLARERLKQSPRFLDASYIQLDNAHLAEADLRQIWLPQASLRNAALRRTDFSAAALYKANLSQADLKEAILTKTNLYKANLVSADFSKANLFQADLRGTDLSKANLSEANLSEANLSEADLHQADLTAVNLSKAKLSGANLSGTNLAYANFSGANLFYAKLSEANLDYANFSETDLRRVDLRGTDLSFADLSGADLSEAQLEEPRSLKGTDLRRVIGLTKEQLATCKAKGAVIDKDPTRNSSQSTAAPSLPLQRNDVQASSAPSAQESTPVSDPGGSSTVSSRPNLEL